MRLDNRRGETTAEDRDRWTSRIGGEEQDVCVLSRPTGSDGRKKVGSKQAHGRDGGSHATKITAGTWFFWMDNDAERRLL